MKISAAIILKDRSILLVRRHKQEGTLLWQFPAGNVENGESTAEAAIRETFEEANIICKSVKKLGKRVHPQTNVEMHYWHCEYLSGEPMTNDVEIEEAIWCPIENIKDYIKSDIFLPVQTFLSKF